MGCNGRNWVFNNFAKLCRRSFDYHTLFFFFSFSLGTSLSVSQILISPVKDIHLKLEKRPNPEIYLGPAFILRRMIKHIIVFFFFLENQIGSIKAIEIVKNPAFAELYFGPEKLRHSETWLAFCCRCITDVYFFVIGLHTEFQPRPRATPLAAAVLSYPVSV